MHLLDASSDRKATLTVKKPNQKSKESNYKVEDCFNFTVADILTFCVERLTFHTNAFVLINYACFHISVHRI